MPKAMFMIICCLMLGGAAVWENAGQAQEMSFIELEGDTDGIWFVAFTPDGKKVVATDLKSTRMWDTETGKELQRLPKLGAHIVCISPDGKKIATESSVANIKKNVQIWDIESGKELQKFSGGCPTYAKDHTLFFTPDGGKIVTVDFDENGAKNTVIIWDVESGKELQKLEHTTNYVLFATFSPDGKKVVTGGWDEAVRIWDTETGKELQKLEGHVDYATIAAFTPDNKKVVTKDRDGTARVWDVESGKELQKLRGRFVALSPNGKKMVTIGIGNTDMRIWDTDS